MKVRIIDNLHCLLGGSLFEFEKGKLNIILGRNGVGKSTLLNSIRGYVEPISTNDYDMPPYLRKKLSKSIHIEEAEGITWFGLTKDDDPCIAIDAYTFASKGGMELNRLSQGEKFFQMFLKIATDIKHATLQGSKTGLIIDEIDSHFDCYYQIKFILVLNHLVQEYATTILMVTHHMGVISECTDCLELKDSEFLKIKGQDYLDKLQLDALF